jgi:DNA-binding transcriptional LysR family regulator
MHISRIDLNLFVIFDTVFTEGGVTAASHTLNLSQPAVSHALARLRALFGDPLFERRGRSMVPTPLARSVIGPVRAALRGMENTLNESAHFDPAGSERRFTLAFRDVLELILIPPLMEAVCDTAQGIEIVATRMDRRSLESDLLTGLVDIAIDVLLPVSPEIRHQRILADPLVVVARKGHPAIRGKLGLKAYLAQQHVQVSSRRRGPGLEDMELARVGVSRRIRLRCQHYGTACRVVSRTDLLATMPQRYAKVINKPYGNQIVPLPLPAARLELYMYWHANAERDPASQWLRAMLHEVIRESGAA